jgi:hydroxyacylglutathione hydrolase
MTGLPRSTVCFDGRMPSAPIEVTAGVHVFTSRREQTTSTLVISRSAHGGHSGRGSSALLTDPAWEPDELTAIAAFIRGQELVIEAGFATHAHFDHVLWHSNLGRAPRYASVVTVERATAERSQLVAALGVGWPPKQAMLVGRVEPLPSAGLTLAGVPVEVITHDGHLPGHSALWLPDRRVLLAGDMLSDVEPPLPSYDDTREPAAAELVAYLAGLDALAPYVARTEVLIPGHGSPTDRPMQRLDADRRHVDALLGAL